MGLDHSPKLREKLRNTVLPDTIWGREKERALKGWQPESPSKSKQLGEEREMMGFWWSGGGGAGATVDLVCIREGTMGWNLREVEKFSWLGKREVLLTSKMDFAMVQEKKQDGEEAEAAN